MISQSAYIRKEMRVRSRDEVLEMVKTYRANNK